MGASSEDEPTVVSEGPVTAMRRTAGLAHNSPQLVVDPDDDRFVALTNRLDDPLACALHVSGDGGQSWAPVDPVGELPQGAESCYAPQVAFGPDGTLYFLFVGLAGEGNSPMGVYLTRSDDGGRSFSEPTRVLGELSFGVRLAVDHTVGDGGRLHVVWLDADEVGVGRFGPPPNPILAVSSDDAGQTWSEPVQVSDADRHRVVAPAVDVGPQGEVEVAYYDLLDDARDYQGLEGPVWDGRWELVVSSSDDGGASFDRGEVVAEVTPHERIMVIFTATPPALAVGPQGRLCVAWADGRHGNADVLARCRPPGEEKWWEHVRVNDTPAHADSTQEMPQLSIAANGRIDVIFYDGRRPPGDDFVDVFHAASTDGGRTFSANTRVSTHTSYTGFGPTYPALESATGMVEFGDRLALASRDDSAVAAWADTRNANARSQGQAIFAATMTGLPDGPNGASLAWWAGGAGTVALGAAGGLVAIRRRRAGGAQVRTEAELAAVERSTS